MNMLTNLNTEFTVLPIDSKLFSERKIFLEGKITAEKACLFAKQIMVLRQEDSKKTINLYINSPGGDIEAGLMIYDIIQSVPAINIFCLGIAYGIAAIILISGKHGRRFMLPNAKLWLYNPLVDTECGKDHSAVSANVNKFLETKQNFDAIIKKHAEAFLFDLSDKTRIEHCFTAQHALAFGLADSIIEFNEMI